MIEDVGSSISFGDGIRDVLYALTNSSPSMIIVTGDTGKEEGTGQCKS